MSAKKENEVAVSIPLDDIEKIESYGWENAVMLDCGGSSQIYLDHERRQVCSSRNVAHVILIYMKKGK